MCVQLRKPMLTTSLSVCFSLNTKLPSWNSRFELPPLLRCFPHFPSGGLNAEYKAKFRSLIFNMKDAANPELRTRVLRGELTPPILVTMGAAELASRTLSEWRCKRQEEATKAVFLDSGACLFLPASCHPPDRCQVQQIHKQKMPRSCPVS